jgi:hypothetical protein
MQLGPAIILLPLMDDSSIYFYLSDVLNATATYLWLFFLFACILLVLPGHIFVCSIVGLL